jgi:hypothetical protein
MESISSEIAAARRLRVSPDHSELITKFIDNWECICIGGGTFNSDGLQALIKGLLTAWADHQEILVGYFPADNYPALHKFMTNIAAVRSTVPSETRDNTSAAVGSTHEGSYNRTLTNAGEDPHSEFEASSPSRASIKTFVLTVLELARH